MHKAMKKQEAMHSEGIKASLPEPALPRIAPIVEEVRAETVAAEIKARVGDDFVACAPKVPSIFDDVATIRAR